MVRHNSYEQTVTQSILSRVVWRQVDVGGQTLALVIRSQGVGNIIKLQVAIGSGRTVYRWTQDLQRWITTTHQPHIITDDGSTNLQLASRPLIRSQP